MLLNFGILILNSSLTRGRTWQKPSEGETCRIEIQQERAERSLCSNLKCNSCSGMCNYLQTKCENEFLVSAPEFAYRFSVICDR